MITKRKKKHLVSMNMYLARFQAIKRIVTEDVLYQYITQRDVLSVELP